MYMFENLQENEKDGLEIIYIMSDSEFDIYAFIDVGHHKINSDIAMKILDLYRISWEKNCGLIVEIEENNLFSNISLENFAHNTCCTTQYLTENQFLQKLAKTSKHKIEFNLIGGLAGRKYQGKLQPKLEK